MSTRTPFAFGLILATSLATAAWGQSVISAHSGVIHLAEGQVSLDGSAVHQKFGEFGDVKTGQTLATQDGRAEVLLTPGVFLRVAENSSFKMVSNKLTDTKLEVLSGTIMVQVDELLQDNVISLTYRDANISLLKKGIYRVDASEQGYLRVFDGEATVAMGSANPVTAKKGREISLEGEKLEAKSFDSKDTDAFYRWNERRDEYISEANVAAARSTRDGMAFTDGGNGGYSTGAGGYGTWAFNPWFGMFTYVPYSGMFYSPFGFGYYSPGMVGYLYGAGSPYLIRGNGVSTASSLPVTRNNTILNGSSARPTIANAGVFNGGGFRGGNGSASETGLAGSSRGNLSTGGSATSGGGLSSGGGGLSSGGGGIAAGAGGARGGAGASRR